MEDRSLLAVVTIQATDNVAAEGPLDVGTYRVSLDAPAAMNTLVMLIASGTASPSDYSGVPGSVVFGPGEQHKTITLTPTPDPTPESAETLTLTLQTMGLPGLTVGSPASATVTIFDTLANVSVTASDASAGEQGPNPGTFTISRTGPTTTALTVAISLGGTASNGSDYASIGGSVVIPQGQASVNVTVTPLDDAQVEQDETVVLLVLLAPGYNLAAPGSATVSIADNDNLPPTADDDEYSIWHDTTLTVAAVAGVLMGDLDPEMQPVTIASYSQPSHGTLTLNSTTGAFTYVPALHFVGDDQFTYRVSDGRSLSNLATVTLHVQNVAVQTANDSFSLFHDRTLEDVAFLLNDPHSDEDPLALTHTSPSHGTLTIVNAQTGQFRYVPQANYVGTDSFTYTVDDGPTSATGVVTLTVTNTIPTLSDKEFSVVHDRVLSVPPLGVLMGVVDLEQDLLTVTSWTPPSGGQFVGQASGAFEFTPPPHTIGDFTFSFVVSDGITTTPGQATIHVTNVDPAPLPDHFMTGHWSSNPEHGGASAELIEGQVLINDFDQDQDPLTVALLSPPAHAHQFTWFGDGRFTYFPASDFVGTDGFTYSVSDGITTSGPVQVTFDMGNRLPNVNDCEFTGAMNEILEEAVEVSLPRLGLDPDFDTIRFMVVQWPANGTLMVGPAGDPYFYGQFAYLPHLDFVGDDFFLVKATDSFAYPLGLFTDPVRVTLHIVDPSPPPAPQDDSYFVAHDRPLLVEAEEGLLANDTTADATRLVLDPAPAAGPAHGQVQLLPDGALKYEPNPGFTGVDQFTYRVKRAWSAASANAVWATATVTITVGNVVPSAAPWQQTVVHDSGWLFVSATDGLLTGATDADQDRLQAALVSGPTSGGQLQVLPSGALRYLPPAGFAGTDTFTFRVSDGIGVSAVHTAMILVSNAPPSAFGKSYTTPHDRWLVVLPEDGLLRDAIDIDDGLLTVLLASTPPAAQGTLTVFAGGGFQFVPAAGFTGQATFAYRISDGIAQSPEIPVTISVLNSAPTGRDDTFVATVGRRITKAGREGVLANDDDLDGDWLAVVLVSGPTHGTLVLDASGAFDYQPAAGYSGGDSFVYRPSDGITLGAATTVWLNATAGPALLLSAAPDGYQVLHGDVLHISSADGLLANDSYSLAEAVVPQLVTQPQHGTLQLTARGGFTYTPAAGYAGPDGFEYRLTQGAQLSAVAAVSLFVFNSAPTVASRAYSLHAGGGLATDAWDGLLADARDADGDPLSVQVVALPAHGTLLWQPQGGFLYTPAADFVGEDSFAYTVSDGVVTTAPLAAMLLVGNAAPEAPSRAYTLAADGATDRALRVAAANGLLAESADADDDLLTVELLAGPAHGTLDLRADGGFRYVPQAGYVGADEFTYRVRDAWAASASATVALHLLASGLVAAADQYVVAAGAAFVVPASTGLLRNDQAATEVTALVAPPAHGSVELSSAGGFVYLPATGYVGPDSFSYRVQDALGNFATASVTLTVQAAGVLPPAAATVAWPDHFSTPHDRALWIGGAAGALFANDTWGLAQAPRVQLVAGPTHGALTLAPDGTFLYVPSAGYVGDDVWTYGLFLNGQMLSSSDVTIAVTNTLPAPPGREYSLHAGTRLVAGGPRGLLAQVVDAEGDPLTVQLVAPTAHGTLTLHAHGALEYAPDPGFVGDDAFTYRISDGQGATSVQTVTLHVTNQAPLAAGDGVTTAPGEPARLSYNTPHDQTLNVRAADGVLWNDSDPDGDLLAAALATAPAHGVLTLHASGAFSYVPSSGYVGADSFTYRATDGLAWSSPVTVNLAVGNAIRTPLGDGRSLAHDRTLVVPREDGLLPDPADLDGDLLEVVLITAPLHGGLSLHANGSFVYQPLAGYVGADSFVFAYSDGVSQSAAATFGLAIVNTLPAPLPGALAVLHDRVLTVEAGDGLLQALNDDQQDLLVVQLVGGPTHGTLVLQEDGSFLYAPDAGYVGVDGFTYQITDGLLVSPPVAVALHVTNAAPVAGGASFTTHHDQPLYVALAGSPLRPDWPGASGSTSAYSQDTDANLDGFVYELVNGPTDGTLSLGTGGQFLYTPDLGFVGTDGFDYRTFDGIAYSNVARVMIGVGNAAPTAGNDAYSVGHFDILSLPDGIAGILANDAQADADPLHAALVSGPAHGTLQLDAFGGVLYVPDRTYIGPDSFVYQITDGVDSDGDGLIDYVQATVHLTVTNAAPTTRPDEYWHMNYVPQGPNPSPTTSFTIRPSWNDVDPDYDVLTLSVGAAPANFGYAVNGDALTITMDAGFRGDHVLTYTVTDPFGATATGSIVIHAFSGKLDEIDIATRTEYFSRQAAAIFAETAAHEDYLLREALWSVELGRAQDEFADRSQMAQDRRNAIVGGQQQSAPLVAALGAAYQAADEARLVRQRQLDFSARSSVNAAATSRWVAESGAAVAARASLHAAGLSAQSAVAAAESTRLAALAAGDAQALFAQRTALATVHSTVGSAEAALLTAEAAALAASQAAQASAQQGLLAAVGAAELAYAGSLYLADAALHAATATADAAQTASLASALAAYSAAYSAAASARDVAYATAQLALDQALLAAAATYAAGPADAGSTAPFDPASDAAYVAAVAAARSAYASALAAADAAHAGAVAAARAAQAAAHDAADAAQATANAGLLSTYRTQVAAAQTSHRAASYAANAAHAGALAAAEAAFAALVDPAQAAYWADVQAADAVYDAALDSAEGAFRAAAQSAEDAYDQDRANATLAYQVSVSAADLLYRAAVDTAIQSWDSDQGAAAGAYDGALSAAAAQRAGAAALALVAHDAAVLPAWQQHDAAVWGAEGQYATDVKAAAVGFVSSAFGVKGGLVVAQDDLLETFRQALHVSVNTMQLDLLAAKNALLHAEVMHRLILLDVAGMRAAQQTYVVKQYEAQRDNANRSMGATLKYQFGDSAGTTPAAQAGLQGLARQALVQINDAAQQQRQAGAAAGAAFAQAVSTANAAYVVAQAQAGAALSLALARADAAQATAIVQAGANLDAAQTAAGVALAAAQGQAFVGWTAAEASAAHQLTVDEAAASAQFNTALTTAAGALRLAGAAASALWLVDTTAAQAGLNTAVAAAGALYQSAATAADVQLLVDQSTAENTLQSSVAVAWATAAGSAAQARSAHALASAGAELGAAQTLSAASATYALAAATASGTLRTLLAAALLNAATVWDATQNTNWSDAQRQGYAAHSAFVQATAGADVAWTTAQASALHALADARALARHAQQVALAQAGEAHAVAEAAAYVTFVADVGAAQLAFVQASGAALLTHTAAIGGAEQVVATAQSLAAQAAAGTLAASGLTQAVAENQAESAFNVALNAALGGLAAAQGQAVETLTNALAAVQVSEEATLAAADLTFVTQTGAADVTWTAALWGDQPPNAPPGQPAGGWVSYVAGSGGVAVTVVQLLEQAAADLVSALALSAEQTVTLERPLLHAHAVSLANARYVVEQELVTLDLQGRVDWLDYMAVTRIPNKDPNDFADVRADRPDSIAWYVLDELVYENTYGAWIDLQENWDAYLADAVLFVGGFVDGLTFGVFGDLLEVVDYYVFAGEFEVSAARESAAWQVGYAFGEIVRDVALLVLVPACGGGALASLARVASFVDDVEAMAKSAINIASGEGTIWDVVTLGSGLFFFRNPFGACFVPDTWADLDVGTGVACAYAESSAPPSSDGDWELSHRLFGGVVVACLGVSLAIIAQGCKQDDERKRQALLDEQFFARLGGARRTRRYDGRARDFLDLEDEEVRQRDADVDSVWDADDEDWLGFAGESSASERDTLCAPALPAPATRAMMRASSARPRTTQSTVALASVLKEHSRSSASRMRCWTLWLAAACCVFFSFRLFRSAAEHEQVAPQRVIATVSAPSASSAERPTRKRIADIQLGERLRGTNPFREQVEELEPDALTWRRVQLVLTKADGTDLHVALLRPSEWFEFVGASVGRTIFLELPEMGAVGHALVTSIDDCPSIASGSGPVVTGTFQHEVGPEGIVRLLIEGESEATGVTPNHPYWSADRQNFIPAGDLRIGERLLTRSGARRVSSLAPDPAYLGFVYNLETTEHVYSVGESGALVHNSCIVSSRMHQADLASSAWRKLSFQQQGLVYVLRDKATGELLKVGQTTATHFVSRFEKYVTAGNRTFRSLAVDIFETPLARRGLIEGEIRRHLGPMFRLPWDNSGLRLNRPGPGIPSFPR